MPQPITAALPDAPAPEHPERGLPLVLSPAQLAAELGVPLKTIYTWNAAGASPTAMRMGKHVRYRRADVETWMEQRAAQGLA